MRKLIRKFFVFCLFVCLFFFVTLFSNNIHIGIISSQVSNQMGDLNKKKTNKIKNKFLNNSSK